MAAKVKDAKFYLGNSKLPRSDMEFEWTPAMVADIKKCKDNILYFAEHFFYIVNLDRGREKIDLYPAQKRILKALKDNRFCIVTASRQCGKSTLTTIFALWMVCFNDDKRVLLIGNKEATAINLFKRVRLAFEMLPNYLKPGVEEWGKTSLMLANGSSIGVSTTSSDAGRGESANCLILDEMAHIENHILEEYWASVYPIITSSKTSKIFIVSTPKGNKNLFYEIYAAAEKGESEWKALKINWYEVPDRDEKWRAATIRNLGSAEIFSQEFECEFLSSNETPIDKELHEKMKLTCKSPEFILEDGNYKIWENPEPNHIYGIGVDPSEGVGKNASCMQVLDLTDLTDIKQVATYHTLLMDPFKFKTKVIEIAKHWGDPPLMIERNNCGAQIVDSLIRDYSYPRIVSYNSKSRFNNNATAIPDGIVANSITKFQGVLNLRYWLNNNSCIKIYDKETLGELMKFEKRANGTWGSRTEKDLDDRVMSLVWTLIILDGEVTKQFFDILEHDTNGKPLKIVPNYNMGGVKNNVFQQYKTGAYAPTIFEIGNSEGEDFNDGVAALQSEGWSLMY